MFIWWFVPAVVIAVFLVVEIPLAVMSALHTISSRFVDLFTVVGMFIVQLFKTSPKLLQTEFEECFYGCQIPIRHFFSQSRRLLTKIFKSEETVKEKFRCL